MKIKHIIIILCSIFIIIFFNGIYLERNINKSYSLDIKFSENSSTFSKGMPFPLWKNNGTAICTENNSQISPQICSDGMGGVIITWQDNRNGTYDIYAQHINSSGYIQWVANGTPICTETGDQLNPQICIDGNGGAIITWNDFRSGSNYDIYVQRINSSGYIMWAVNGTPICTKNGYQIYPKICSDEVGGAIITWQDSRGGSQFDIYAQRINSNGYTQWADNGTAICTTGNDQYYPQLCNVGIDESIITWQDFRSGLSYDIYAQKVNSSGYTQWANNGTAICTANNDQMSPQLCNDGARGAIIIWTDYRTAMSDIYAQQINSSGNLKWAANGTPICTENFGQDHPQLSSDGAGGAIITWDDQRNLTRDIYSQHIDPSGVTLWAANGTSICRKPNNQIYPQICSDGTGGAIITWEDSRSGNYDIYVQWINSSGFTQWIDNGTPICTESNDQTNPQICRNGTVGAIITWEDLRNGVNDDIYTQFVIDIEDQIPTSNHPADIVTSAGGAEKTNWILYDDYGTGKYRVWVNDTNGNLYIWTGWNSWDNNIPLNIPINRTAPGIYNYTIEYYDNINQFGIPDTVIITIIDNIPTSNHPSDIATYKGGSEAINWSLYDDFGSGQYRVWANDTNGNFYIWKNWDFWLNNTLLNIPLNRTASGIYNYTIEYYDNYNQFGILDMVIVNIIDRMPTSNHPGNIQTTLTGSETITWILYDDFGPGQYRLLVNDTNSNFYVLVDWTPWINNTPIYLAINRTVVGIFNYTIEFNSSTGQVSNDTVIVTIIKPYQSLELFITIFAIQFKGGILDFILSPFGLIIIGSFVVILAIIITLIAKKKSKKDRAKISKKEHQRKNNKINIK